MKAALDPLKQEIKTQLQTVEDGQTFSRFLERGSYSLTTGDSDVKLSSTELVYLEIISTSSHYNLELKGPIYVYGQAQAVDATIIVDAENKTSPFLAITGDDLKLTMKREGKTDEDFKIWYGNIRYNWKVNKKQNGINHVYQTTFYGFVLGYNNVDFYTFSGITDPYTDSNVFQVDVIYAKIPLSAAAIISIIVVSVVVVVGGIIAGVVVYCVVIKPKKQAKENNPPAV
ncbi:hypothetical protein TRFO_06687 [Tritrichomonas foetus]|uniref:Uncharacterized protein n=1 Tax=Tritrichomonas foetus TaxID=1144522 RepID=A0A1J4JWR3_9EUKA|nr:hypothetical protein TRFO_06687 [Tritrichomonas foetus]|eukprot:OHT03443.1 hypothetical protein TRFO_06687 [Tritrichomonas foetus]